MATEVDIAIGVKLDQLRRQMAQIPDITKKEVNAAVAAASKAWRRQERAAKRAAKASRISISSVNDQVKKLGEVAQGSLGGVLGRVGGLVELFTGLGSVGGPIALTAAAVGGLAVGFVAVETALIGTVLAADDLIKSQERLVNAGIFEPIDPETEESITRVNGAVAGLGEVWNRVVITLATGVAPAIEETSVGLLALGLQAQDAFAQFVEGKNLLREFAVFATDTVIQLLLGPFTQIADAIGSIGDALTFLGAPEVGAALTGVREGFDGLTRTASEWVVDGIGDAMASSFGDMAEGAKDYNAEAEAMILTLTAVETKADGVTKSAKKMTAALKPPDSDDAGLFDSFLDTADQLSALINKQGGDLFARLSPSEQVISRYQTTIGEVENLRLQLEALAETGIDVSGAMSQIPEAMAEANARLGREMADLSEQVAEGNGNLLGEQVDFAIGLVSTAGQAMGDLFDELGVKSKAAATATAVVQKAAAIAAITRDTSVAVMSALTIPPPAGQILAGVAIATGAVQAAKVAATPTSFHSGGLAPDEGMKRVQKGEGFLSLQGVAALNRGQSGGNGEMIVVTQVNHKVYDAQTEQALSSGSPLRKSMIRSSRTGRGAYGRVRSK